MIVGICLRPPLLFCFFLSVSSTWLLFPILCGAHDCFGVLFRRVWLFMSLSEYCVLWLRASFVGIAGFVYTTGSTSFAPSPVVVFWICLVAPFLIPFSRGDILALCQLWFCLLSFIVYQPKPSSFIVVDGRRSRYVLSYFILFSLFSSTASSSAATLFQ